jgi:RND family efflux transporter MFP subunit
MERAGSVLFIALGLIVATACSSRPVATTVAAAESVASPAVVAPERQPLPPKSAATPEYVASGPIIVEDQVDVAAQRDGVVSRVLAEPGTPVKKGQVLAVLDDRQIAADVEAARAKTLSTEADLKNWEAEAKVLEVDYERAEKMWEAHIIPIEQLEHARYKAESDQWDVKRVSELLVNAKQVQRALELELEKTQIMAPFDGVVARRYVRMGQSVAKNDRLFWVTAVAPMRIRITLPEKFVWSIKPGAMVAVTPSDMPDGQRRYKAKVIEVSPVVDPASDTIEVLAQLSGDTSGLRPGMRADVHLANVP